VTHQVLLITPPFTQLNTPYPATAYLKGFLNTQNRISYQSDLGIEVILRLFTSAGLRALFDSVGDTPLADANCRRILNLRDDYEHTIDAVIAFLQDQNPTLSNLICSGNYLPEASRFDQIADLEWAFGAMGTRDKARHLATLYLEDLADFIKETVDKHFGFSRYAERLGSSASSFDTLHKALEDSPTYIDKLTLDILAEKMDRLKPDFVALSVPFPGNLYSALRCGKFIKEHYPNTKVCLGGGYANTELRSLTEIRVFNYVDYITLDDGEAPILHLLEYLEQKRPIELLKRTFALQDNRVVYFNGSLNADYKQANTGIPDYEGLPINRYLSVIEIANPMHRLWSDGRWNKLTLAHGCYWGKCSFCDISLDYIKTYETASAALLVDKMEALIAQTGERGFHFVDEAAPPALMREVALEILRRKLTIIWWTNIRFEKSFTADLCQLLAASGCIAVSGGLEVASDRLLALMQKGVTVAQVARVADNFTNAGVMVHAYLMYGFPTQTEQETVDALEVVRQLFEAQVVQSGFWHRFAMTAHSPVGMNPEKYKVKKITEAVGAFANNDLEHIDPEGCNHELFGHGLRKSLFNYMHGVCFDFPLQDWFDFKIPKTTVPRDYIVQALNDYTAKATKPTAKMVWLGGAAHLRMHVKKKKGKMSKMARLKISVRKGDIDMELPELYGLWLHTMLQKIDIATRNILTFAELQKDFESFTGQAFDPFWHNDDMNVLRAHGLLAL
jgi:radical SAM superfamily enzyme YgiQ (UPF0313 family)